MLSHHQQLKNAHALINGGQVLQAEMLARQVLAAHKKSGDAMAIIGLVAVKKGKFDEAISWHQKSIATKRNEPLYYCNLANAYASGGDLRRALSGYERALKMQPDLALAIAGKAAVLERRGKLDRARAILEPHVRRPAAPPRITALFARLEQRQGNSRAAVEFAREQLARDDVQGLERRQLLFVLGMALEQLQEYDEAFVAFAQANETFTKRYDVQRTREDHDQIMRAFPPEMREQRPRASHGSAVPVFIASMPRAGSTLVEQIIHAHPQCYGAGELPDLTLVINDMQDTVGTTEPYPAGMLELKEEDLNTLASHYLQRLQGHQPSAQRITDKSLDLYRHLGAITVLFPQAHIIHVTRDPEDTCLSCFLQDLNPQQHVYASDLRDLGQHYREYARLTAFWRDTLGDAVLDVRYEDLIEDQEGVSRRIIEFIGVEWNEACLRFHEAKRDVVTLSYEQVRRKIYASSVGRHEHYDRHLEPLREGLGDLVGNGRPS